jgi:hypothetical protein
VPPTLLAIAGEVLERAGGIAGEALVCLKIQQPAPGRRTAPVAKASLIKSLEPRRRLRKS